MPLNKETKPNQPGEVPIKISIFLKICHGPRDWGSIPGQVMPKIQKMVLDASLLNTQHYKVHVKGKV